MAIFSDLCPNDILEKTFECSCGRVHTIPITRIEYAEGTLANLPSELDRYRETPILLVSDTITYSIAGKKIHQQLTKAGFHIEQCCYARKQPLVPDERALGEALSCLGQDTGFVLGVGSGVINDICRFFASRTKIPYGIIATAPSMDGYASSISPLIFAGKKSSYLAGYPVFILSEPDILENAPDIMIQAGFGDVLGKMTALADWNLSVRMKQEHQCAECIELVERSVEAVITNASKLSQRSRSAILELMDTLVLSGLAMGLYGNSRPASGAEHHLSHFWEVDAIEKGSEHALHGNMVGTACYVSALLYEKARSLLPKEFILPDTEKIKSLLMGMNMPLNPVELGVSCATFHTSIQKAMHARERYTILRFLSEHGLLKAAADEITLRFYGEKPA